MNDDQNAHLHSSELYVLDDGVILLTIVNQFSQDCEARFFGDTCVSCAPDLEDSASDASCRQTITANCTNIGSEYSKVTVCPLEMRRHNHSFVDDNLDWLVFTPLGFIALCCVLLPFCLFRRRRRDTEEGRPQYSRVSTGITGRVTSGRASIGMQAWIELPQRRHIVAREDLQDGCNSFDFFDPIDGDPIATELRQQCDRADWQALRDLLANLRPLGDDNNESQASHVTAVLFRHTVCDDLGIELRRLSNGTYTIFRLSANFMQGNGLAVGMPAESINGVAIAGQPVETCTSLLHNSVGEVTIVAPINIYDKTQNNKRSFYFTAVGAHLARGQNGDEQNYSCGALLDHWVAAEPDNSDCHILRAIVFVKRAWQAPSMTGNARRTARFRANLRLATKELQRARELCPSDPLVYAEAIPVGLGLGNQCGNKIEATSCLSSLLDLTPDPLHYTAHLRALQYYCKKKHGSHERMFSFARETTAELPDCHPLWVLIPMAHYEYVFYERNESHWTRPDVVEEILCALRKAFPGSSETCIQATGTAGISQEWTSRNYFAYCLIATGLLEEARRQIRVIGKRPTRYHPWKSLKQYLGALESLGFETRVDSSSAICTTEPVTDPSTNANATDGTVDPHTTVAHAEIVSVGEVGQQQIHQSPIEAEAVAVAVDGGNDEHVDAGEAVVVHIV